MKILKITFVILLSLIGSQSFAQTKAHSEQFGNTLNLGVGIGYYNYIGYSTPVLHADFEFNIAHNFTLAPFITYYSYSNYNYWGSNNYTYKDYYYHETIVPMGVKGAYYFDELLGTGPKWDLYLGGSLGFTLRNTTWDNGYYGESTVKNEPGPLFLDLHIGTEYHLTHKAGIFIDLSTGVSTLGLAVHF